MGIQPAPQELLARCHSPLSPSSLMKMSPWRTASTPQRGWSSQGASTRSAGTPVLGRHREASQPCSFGVWDWRCWSRGPDSPPSLLGLPHPFQPACLPCVNPLSCLLQVRGRRGGEPILEVAGHNLKRLPVGGMCEGLAAEEKGEIDEGHHGKNPSSDFSQPP